ncbi:hypothetical protein GFL88_03265 [Rhizobium leguminosarum bv. viciae]|uniref:pentapeptide repeat-containing protein n=1 Tax=Rhizobium leguminosarum TaxID=384 RepID=UPI001441A600|nr:pentapeptide repeat-containing protein [Rhizobium leguminosarum]NKK62564.1 hypothetical protein [Rhizobium leguminosarum bv. viciae]
MMKICLALILANASANVVMALPLDCDPHQLLARPSNLPKLLKDHRQWLATQYDPVRKGSPADLSYRDLTGIKLKGSDLREAKFIGSKLHGANFERSRLDLADLSCASGDNVSFESADLFGSKLVNASLVGSKLSQAKLGGSDLSGALLTNADLSAADMRRVDLSSAVLVNTALKDARFADAIVSNAVWQPRDEPDVKTMGSVVGLQSLELSARSDPGAMTRLVKSLREAGLEDRAKEVAHAREIVLTKIDFEKWRTDGDVSSAIMGGFRWIVGALTNYGLSLGRGIAILIGVILFFVPIYFIWGFSPAYDRPTGLVRTIPAGTLVPGSGQDTVTTDAKIERLTCSTPISRIGWSAWFSFTSTLRLGVGQVNLLEWLEKVIGLRPLGATGRLGKVANVQAFISVLLLLALAYAYQL